MSLALLNKNIRDDNILFTPQYHKYQLLSKPNIPIKSVTSLIHSMFKPFNAGVIIQKMRQNSQKFSESKYSSMTDEEIKNQWSSEAKVASTKGTETHKQIEDYYDLFFTKILECREMRRKLLDDGMVLLSHPEITKKDIDRHLAVLSELDESTLLIETKNDSVEFKQFLSFTNSIKLKLVPYRTEWSIYIEDLNLAGQLDILYRIKGTDTFALYDWKRSKEIKMENTFEKGLGCLSHLDNCNFIHYSLQLNIYKYILENYYTFDDNKKFKIVEMKLVILHPDQEEYKIFEVASMTEEVKNLLLTLK